MVEPGNNFDDYHDEEPHRPLLPPEDRLWRHPSEMGSSTGVLPVDQVLAARRRWLASTPSRAGAGTAGLVGALLATGVVLIGTHLTSWLTPHRVAASQPNHTLPLLGSAITTVSTTPALQAAGLSPVLSSVGAALVRVRAFSSRGSAGADGVIISPNGYVVAPSSVVSGASSVSVLRSDGEQLIARVLGNDSAVGIAVLKIEGSGLPWIELSPARTGLANAFTLLAWRSQSLEMALANTSVSPARTSLANGPALLELCPPSLHLSSAPNGALIIDAKGEISGIVASHRDHQVIATPGWLAARIAADLIADGRVTHGWLGIKGRATRIATPLTTDKTSSTVSSLARVTPINGTGDETGVQVMAVEPKSAASKAGLRPGDVIEAVDGQRVSTMAGLQGILYLMTPSTPVHLEIVRAGRMSEMSARLQAAA
ncbi:MAG: S1C family serine protease [Acidimicrobiales bacterium]